MILSTKPNIYSFHFSS